jgi:hypothetical protein
LPAAQRSRLLVQGLENHILNLTLCAWRTLGRALLLLLLLLLPLLHHLPAHAHLLLEIRCHFEGGRGRATLLQGGGPTRNAREQALVVNMEGLK